MNPNVVNGRLSPVVKHLVRLFQITTTASLQFALTGHFQLYVIVNKELSHKSP